MPIVFAGNVNVILDEPGTETLEDTWLQRIDNPNTNYGVTTSLLTDDDRDWIAYLKFNTTIIPDDATILETYLGLYESNDDGTDMVVYHVTNDSWVAGNNTGGDCTVAADCKNGIIWYRQPCGQNFNKADSCNLTVLDTISTDGSAGDWELFNVTAAMKRDLVSDNNFSLAVNPLDQSGSNQIFFRSSEYTADATQRPFLNITYSTESVEEDTSSDWCYQENATNATSCGAISGGKYGYNGTFDGGGGYPETNCYDGNWITSCGSDANNAWFFVNYSKPTTADKSSQILLYMSGMGDGKANFTINKSCWEQEPLQFAAQVYAGMSVYFYCWNTTDWIEIKNVGDAYFYEEAMWWNLSASASATNPTIVIDHPTNNDTLDNSIYPVYINGTVNITDGVPNATWINNTNFNNAGDNTNFNFTINGTLTDGKQYHLKITSNNSDGDEDTETIYFNYDVSPPTLITNFRNNHSLGLGMKNLTVLFNFTDDISVLQYNFSTPEGIFISGTNNGNIANFSTTINTTKLKVGKHNFSIEVCDEYRTSSSLNCYKEDLVYHIINYTADYTQAVQEAEQTMLNLTIHFNNIYLEGNGTLNYDGTDYQCNISTEENKTNLFYEITVPDKQTVYFYWDFTVNSTAFNTTIFNQSVNRVQAGICNGSNINALNISIFNENHPTKYIPGDIDAVFYIWTNTSTELTNFTFEFANQTNYSVCISPNTTMYADAVMYYNTSGGYNMRWYLDNITLSPATQLLDIYNFESQSQSELRGTLRDTSFDYFSQVITQLQRFYPDENIWRTVQIDRSDFNGQVVFYITENSQDYRLVFIKDGRILDSTEELKFLCDSSVCEVTFIVDDSTSTISPKLLVNVGYDNNTEVFQVNWTDTTGITNSIRLKVTQERGDNQLTICDTTVSSSSGTINCDTTGYTGNLKAMLYKSQSPEIPFLTKWIPKSIRKLFQYADIGIGDAGLWAAGIVSTLAIAGSMFHPILGIAIYVFSLFIINALQLLGFVTFGLITVMTVIGMVISLLIKK